MNVEDATNWKNPGMFHGCFLLTSPDVWRSLWAQGKTVCHSVTLGSWWIQSPISTSAMSIFILCFQLPLLALGLRSVTDDLFGHDYLAEHQNTNETISDLLSNDSLEEHQNTSENISDPLVQLATPSNVFGCKHVTSSSTELVDAMAKQLEFERYSTSCAIAERKDGMTLQSRACSKSTITRVWKWSWKSCLVSQKVNLWTPWQGTGIGKVFNKLRHCWKKDGMRLQSRACSKSTITRVWKWSWKSCLLSQAAKSWTPWQSTGIGKVFNKLRHCWKEDGMTLQSRGCSKSTLTRVWKWSWKSCLLSQAPKSWTPWQSTGIREVFNKLRHCWKKDGMRLQSRACSKSTITRVWKWSWKSCLVSQKVNLWTPWQSTGIGKV